MVRLAASADQQGPPPSMRQTAARGNDQGRLLRLVRHEGDLVSRSVRDPDYRQPVRRWHWERPCNGRHCAECTEPTTEAKGPACVKPKNETRKPYLLEGMARGWCVDVPRIIQTLKGTNCTHEGETSVQPNITATTA